MAKQNKSSNQVNQIFNDLDRLRNFCREYGYRFDERDLYENKSYVYRQFQKFLQNKNVKNQWDLDLAKFKEKQKAR